MPSLDRRHTLPFEEPDGRALTAAFTLMADNQIHHLFGDPYWVRTELADRVVKEAIRPVQLDLFGPDLLGWALARPSTRYMPVLHLGDALDVGCHGELTRFFEVMQGAAAGWFMVPGNHDFYFVGNGHVSRRHWARACKRADGRITKNEFIVRYLDEGLGGQQHDEGARPGLAALQQLRGADPGTDAFELDAQGPRGLLTGARWRLHDSPWRSYLVQRLDLGWTKQARPVVAILLDTTQYGVRPRVLPTPRNAGLDGSILGDQRQAVRELLRGAPADAAVVLMGHHHHDALTRPARAFLDELAQTHAVVAYVSAHTHAGHYAVHRLRNDPDANPDANSDANRAQTLLELNVGSLVDWPLEYRELRLKSVGEPGQVLMASPRHRLDRLWRQSQEGQQCDPAWERAPAHYVAPDGHGYAVTSVRTQVNLFAALLDTFAALLQAFPSESAGTPGGAAGGFADDAAAQAAIAQAHVRLTRVADDPAEVGSLDQVADTLMRLEAFDRARPPADRAGRDRYRLCQAFWASKYDRLRARAPQTDDPYVVVDAPARRPSP